MAVTDRVKPLQSSCKPACKESLNPKMDTEECANIEFLSECDFLFRKSGLAASLL